MSLETSPSELLYSALGEEFGVLIQTTDVKKLLNKLYPIRADDPSLLCLSFHPSPINPKTELFIVKKESSDGS